MVNALSVDVEEYFQVSAFDGIVSREDWDGMESRVAGSTARLLGLLAEYGVRATFFVLGWVAKRDPALVRRIADAGHEVACHGLNHRLVYDRSPEQFRIEVDMARRILQDASGQPVTGHRAASFSITRRSLWALDVLAEVGFEYDSSIFPVIHDRYGIPGAPRNLYRVELRGGASLIEAPPSTLRLGPIVLPVAGGGYFRLYPRRFTRWAIGRLNRTERMPAVVYVHPWEFDPDQPRFRGVPRLRSARHYVNIGKTLDRLSFLLTSFRFDTLGSILGAAGPLPVERIERT